MNVRTNVISISAGRLRVRLGYLTIYTVLTIVAGISFYLNSMLFPNCPSCLKPADKIHQRNEEEDTSDQTRTSGSSCLGVLSECYTGHDPRYQTCGKTHLSLLSFHHSFKNQFDSSWRRILKIQDFQN